MGPRVVLGVAAAAFLSACAGTEADPHSAGDDSTQPREGLHAVGDSVLAWWGNEGDSIPDKAAEGLGLSLVNSAISGAQVLDEGDEGIPSQYLSGPWDVVLIDGGANDLADRCGCGDCDSTLDAIISADASSGVMVSLVDRALADAQQVVVFDYYRTPPGTEFEPCFGVMEELETRYNLLASSRDRLTVVDGEASVSADDLSDWDEDRIHPSKQGAAKVGAAIAAALQ